MHEFLQNWSGVRRNWVKFAQFKRANFECCASVTPNSCSEHFTEWDFINFMVEYQMGFASKQNLYGCPQGNWLGKKFQFESPRMKPTNSKHTAQYQKWRYTNTLKQVPTRQTQKVQHKCLWQKRMWKKETTRACGEERKMAALLWQANSRHQMKETKQLKPSQKSKPLPTCKHKVEKKNTTV